MEVTNSLIDKLSNLSRLQFSELEKEEIKGDLQKMISFVEKLNELNLEGVEPLLHIAEEINVLREDEVKGQLEREQALKNAPLDDGQFFKVPKVIREG
jgi:aspartyl-tRNA(Asn)/glutamyl-tRNA(Gln) amidotransferase subunit C